MPIGCIANLVTHPYRVHQVPKVPRVSLVLVASLGMKDPQEMTVLLDPKVPLALQALLEVPVCKVMQEYQVKRVLQATQENQVYVEKL